MKQIILDFLQALVKKEKDKVKVSNTLKAIATYLQAILNSIDDALGANLEVPSTGNPLLDMALSGIPFALSYIEKKTVFSQELKDIIDWIASIVDVVVKNAISPTLQKVMDTADSLNHAITQSTIPAPQKEPLAKLAGALTNAVNEHIGTLSEKAA